MMRAIYPGTFDPITKGHVDIAHRASRMFTEVIVAVADSRNKQPMFDLDNRVQLAKQALQAVDNVQVKGFDGLLVDFARIESASILVRGLRAVSDFEYEMQLAGLNREMSPQIDTVFIASSHEFQFLSSSMVREIARLGGKVSQFVPSVVAQRLQQQQANKDRSR